MPVTLINPFEVPAGKEAEALAFWEKAAAFMKQQPGFISTRLHRALVPWANFLVNQPGRVGIRRAFRGRRQ